MSAVASTSGLPCERKTWENQKEASRRSLKCSVGWSTGHGKGAGLLQPGEGNLFSISKCLPVITEKTDPSPTQRLTREGDRATVISCNKGKFEQV